MIILDSLSCQGERVLVYTSEGKKGIVSVRNHTLYPVRKGRRFKNPNPNFQERGPLSVARWIFWDSLKRKKVLSFGIVWDRDRGMVPPCTLDGMDIDFLLANRSVTTITWIGHSSFLIQIDGINLLTDPVWSNRIFGGLGPCRFMPPGIPLAKLPGIDLIHITHNHYDHLDVPTIRTLGNTPQYVVPLGVDSVLIRHGITNVRALSWWECAEFGPLRIHSVPAQHFSVRGPFDRDASLWTGWLIQGSRHRIYFAGDTGFFGLQFREIKNRFAPIDVAILPIGAYRPRWLMQPMHLCPFEAVEAFKVLEAGLMVPCHWGTFKLSEESLGDPIHDLKSAAAEQQLSPDSLWIPQPGKTRRIGEVRSLSMFD